ncbi:MAG: hypothetical protein MZU95_14365 [Desulfomicrobium escambiense]|nr:hypothetical protein [Desulfomicrobium escambiense]
MMLPADVFQTLSGEFNERWRAGERNIRLSPIVCPELRDVSDEIIDEQKAEERTAASDADSSVRRPRQCQEILVSR